MRDQPQAVLITGAGSGLGLECSLFLAARNYQVFGTVLDESEQETLGRESIARKVSIRIHRMDVTRPDEIRATVGSVLQQAGTLHALVYFAGMGLRGFIEDLSLEEIRQVFDVNVFGAILMAKAVLPHMRQRRGGRIVITSSTAGRMASMSIGGYASSKFAVEGFAEALAQEARLFNVRVSLVEPGLVFTPHFTVNRNRARKATDPSGPNYRWFSRHEQIVDGILARRRITPEDVARTVQSILKSRSPRLRYVVGTNAKLIFALRRYLPGEWFERAYWAAVRRMVTAPDARPPAGQDLSAPIPSTDSTDKRSS